LFLFSQSLERNDLLEVLTDHIPELEGDEQTEYSDSDHCDESLVFDECTSALISKLEVAASDCLRDRGSHIGSSLTYDQEKTTPKPQIFTSNELLVETGSTATLVDDVVASVQSVHDGSYRKSAMQQWVEQKGGVSHNPHEYFTSSIATLRTSEEEPQPRRCSFSNASFDGLHGLPLLSKLFINAFSVDGCRLQRVKLTAFPLPVAEGLGNREGLFRCERCAPISPSLLASNEDAGKTCPALVIYLSRLIE
jgi:hypothetical protein